MDGNIKILKRKSIRLKGYDYTKPNGYFITICVHEMEKVFGTIYQNEVILNELGNCAKEFWLDIPEHFQKVILDQYVIMPNHVHGIIRIVDDFFLNPVGVQYIEPLQQKEIEPLQQKEIGHCLNSFQRIAKGSIGSIIRSYKAAVTRWANTNGYIFKWQRNYFDRIIRTEKEFENIQGYIFYNPVKWYYENGVNVEKVFEK